VGKPKLVTLETIGQENFTHFVDLQGRIESDNIGYVSPRGQGGQVRAVYVKQGQTVSKGSCWLN
jgi:multidrug efflux pump subunit AcrA (membrane-fusion protein)